MLPSHSNVKTAGSGTWRVDAQSPELMMCMYVHSLSKSGLHGGPVSHYDRGPCHSREENGIECTRIRKTPTIPMRGPMPLSNQVGMGMTVDMLFNSLTAQPRLKGENFIQFDLMRKPRVTFTSTWESTPAGISEGATFATGTMKVTVTTCHTQQRWFGLFMQ
jgi:hypothetical protein